MVGWHHQLKGHEFEQPLVDSERHGNLAFCDPWGCKKPDRAQVNDKQHSPPNSPPIQMPHNVEQNSMCNTIG